MIVKYRFDEEQKNVAAYIHELDKLVLENADIALDLTSLDLNNPKQDLWHKKAMAYIETGKKNNIYTAYGYAVEELTNLRIHELHTYSFGLAIQTQVNSGTTRPDIVIEKEPDIFFDEILAQSCMPETIAWIDITSEDSIGHINGKVGGKWGTAPCVVEIAYPTLDVSQIRVSEENYIAGRAKAQSAARRQELINRVLMGYMVGKMDRILEELNNTIQRSSTKIKKAEIARCFFRTFPLLPGYGQSHVAFYSLLKMYLKQGNGSHQNTADYIVKQIYKSRQQQNKSIAEKYLIQSYKRENGENNRICFNYAESDDEE